MIKVQPSIDFPIPETHSTKVPENIQERTIEEDAENIIPIKSLESLCYTKEKSNDSESLSHDQAEHEYELLPLLKKTERSEREAWFIYTKLKDHKFFTDFLENTDEQEKLDASLYICQKLQYEAHETGSIIFRQGEFSDGKVYLVLSGEIFVITNEQEPTTRVLPEEIEEKSKEEKYVYSARSNMKDDSVSIENSRDRIHLPLDSQPENTGMHTENTRSPSVSPTRRYGVGRRSTVNSLNKLKTLPSLVKLIENTETLEHFENIAISPIKKTYMTGFRSLIPSMENTPTRGALKRQKVLASEQISAVEDIIRPERYGRVVHQLSTGAFFGERALVKRHRRDTTALTSGIVELLTLGQTDYEYVQNEFSKAKRHLLSFINNLFPHLEKLESPILVENISATCEIKNCIYQQVIISEGTIGEEFYIVYEGKCEIIKTFVYDKSDTLGQNMAETKSLYGLKKTSKEQVIIMNMEKGIFFGEEILFNNNSNYEYTVRAVSEKTRLLCFKKPKFLGACPKIIVDGINKLYLSKKQRIKRHLMTKLEKKGAKATPKLLEEVKPVLAFPKAQLTYGPNLHQNSSIFTLTERPSRASSTGDVRAHSPFASPKKTPRHYDENRPRHTPTVLKLPLSEFSRTPVNDGSESPKKNSEMSPEGGLQLLLSHGMHGLPQPKALIASMPSTMRSHETSPGKGGGFRLSASKITGVGTGGDFANYIEILQNKANNEDNGEPRESDSYINDVNNFKADFGKQDINIDKKYKSLKIKQGIIKPQTPEVKLKVSLADFVTLKLREKRYITPVEETPKSSNISPIRNRNSFLTNSPSVKDKRQFSNFKILGSLMDTNFTPSSNKVASTSRPQTRSIELNKFKFVMQADSPEKSPSRPPSIESGVNNIHVKRRAESNIRSAPRKGTALDFGTPKRERPGTEISKFKAQGSPSIIKMETHYASGLPWKLIRKARRAASSDDKRKFK